MWVLGLNPERKEQLRKRDEGREAANGIDAFLVVEMIRDGVEARIASSDPSCLDPGLNRLQLPLHNPNTVNGM